MANTYCCCSADRCLGVGLRSKKNLQVKFGILSILSLVLQYFAASEIMHLTS